MITTKNLPDSIAKTAKQYLKSNERFDVFPSKFFVDNVFYYYFTYAPASEQLIIREDGIAPSFNEIKHAALIAEAYNTSIVTIYRIGFRWSSLVLGRSIKTCINR